MLQVLIDGDMFAYRSCAACERDTDWGNDIWTLHVDLNEAKEHFEDTLEEALTDALNAMQYSGDYKVTFCFSSSKNFRKKILATYKANRAGKRKPVGYAALVSWCKDNYDTVVKDWLEADDCIGILATIPKNKGNALIISGDKDMGCIPAYRYDFIRKTFTNVSDDEAQRAFYTQTLMGDATDGYSGCPKIGKVTAGRILDKECSWDAVKEAYEKAGLSEDVAIQQARVAKILLATDYDFKKQKVKLWKPTEAL